MGRLSSFLQPENAIDAVIPLTLFFGLGIWLVVLRYKTIRDRAVLFYWPPPPVRVSPHIARVLGPDRYIQEANPEFQGFIIEKPSLESHLNEPTLLPATATRDRKYITSFDPATGMHLRTFMADNERDIENKILKAADAQRDWAHSTFPERKRVMKSLKRWLVENQTSCARVACRDTGKTCTFISNFD